MDSSFNTLITLLLAEYLAHYFELTSIDKQDKMFTLMFRKIK